jgi:hypothetical protein
VDQRPSALLDVGLLGNLRRNVRVYAETRALVGGPARHGTGLGFVDIVDTFQNPSPSVELEEAYLDFFASDLDVRVGKQKFSWGRLDAFQPTDVINPKRFLEPFLTDEKDAKIGVPAARGTYFLSRVVPAWLGEANATLVWVPVPVPTRFPLPDERWFPSGALVPSTLRIPPGFVPSPVPGLTVPAVAVEPVVRVANRRPPQQLDEGGVAARLAGLTRGVDWALAFYDGPETIPAFDFTTVVESPRARRRSRRPGFAPDLDDLRRLVAVETLRPRFGRIRLVGADAAFQLAGFSVRVEGAYAEDRLLTRMSSDVFSLENIRRALGPRPVRVGTDLLLGKRVRLDLGPLVVPRDTVSWGIGADYSFRGTTFLVQANQLIVLDNPTELLFNDVDSQILVAVRRTFLADRLRIEVPVIQGIERGYTTALPSATYEITDDLRVRIGFLFVAGSRRTLTGQFQDHDEGFIQLRYSY